ncbi:hypothetical protein [Pseudomonas moraviensis]
MTTTKPALPAMPIHTYSRSMLWLAHLAPALLTVVFIWLPFGFLLTGLIEEWGVIGLFSRAGLFFVTDISSPLPAHALRPLTVFPHAVAYFLDPNSFNFWHILLMVALTIKGASLSLLTTRVTGSIKWGMFASILVIIYPADTMQLSFRAIHINWALSLVLIGSVLLLAATDQNSKLRGTLLSLAAGFLLACASAMYEASLLLVAIPFLVAFAQTGFKRLFSNLKDNCLYYVIWVSGALTYIAYVIHTAPLVKSYQSVLAGGSALTTLMTYYPNLFKVGLFRSIFGGWIDALRITRIEIISYWYLVVATALLMGLIYIFLKRSVKPVAFEEKSANLAIVFRLALIGLALICIGYAPFLLSPPHMAISQRTFLFATPGAVLFAVSMLWALSKASKALTSAGFAALIFTGLAFQLFQFHHYIEISRQQQLALRDIVQNFDGNAADKTLLILDYNNQLNHVWMFLNPDLANVLTYIYGKPVNDIQVCYMPSREWQAPTPSVQRKGTCEEGKDDWTFNFPSPVTGPGMELAPATPSMKLSKSKVVTVVVGGRKPNAENGLSASYRTELESGDTPTSLRYRGITETKPWFDFFKFRDQLAKDEYSWGFGNWWNLDLPTAGSGWRDADWEPRRFNHIATAWMNAPQASLYFDIEPKNAPYVLSGFFDAFPNEASRSNMKFRINGAEIPVEWSEVGKFTGAVDPKLLKTGRNVLEFETVPNHDYYGYSARLDWVKIVPE